MPRARNIKKVGEMQYLDKEIDGMIYRCVSPTRGTWVAEHNGRQISFDYGLYHVWSLARERLKQ